MGHIVRLDAEGHLLYEGLLSSQEIATIDEILQALKEEILQIEADLEETYGKSVLYKYNLGKILGELLTKYDISFTERRKFWDEIKNFATKEDRKETKALMQRRVAFMVSAIDFLNMIKRLLKSYHGGNGRIY